MDRDASECKTGLRVLKRKEESIRVRKGFIRFRLTEQF